MLPNLENSFMASYRPLFSRILSAAIKQKQQQNNQTTTEKTITLSNNENASINPGNAVAGENLDKLIVKENGLYKNLIPYNGFKYNGKEEKYVQLIDLGGSDNKWLRARVIRMGGPSYTINDDNKMLLLSGSNINPSVISWSDIKTTLSEYYSTRVNPTQANKDAILGYKTEFLNPRINLKYTLEPLINSSSKIYNGPVTEGPDSGLGNFGIGMSVLLMKKLKVNEGDVVYFRLI
jgi:hypothetical protein